MSLQNSSPLLFLPFLSSFFKKWIQRGSPLKGKLFEVLFSNSLLLRENRANKYRNKLENGNYRQNRAGIFEMYRMKL